MRRAVHVPPSSGLRSLLVIAATIGALLLGVSGAGAEAPADARSAEQRIVERARLEVTRRVAYDPAWVQLGYPNGDPPENRGVCTDVVVRAYRAAGVDFQARVHDDVRRRPDAYATIKRADPSIDHRRVGPLLTYLRGHARAAPLRFDDPSAWRPGDIVVWALRSCPTCSPDHVGIVSDRRGPRGLPMVIHNIGPIPTEEDRLDAWTVLGHFRWQDLGKDAR